MKSSLQTYIENPKKIGEGTYGCVHRPSLKCKDKKRINYEGKISKLGEKKVINDELGEYKIIDNIDKSSIFYPGKPDMCLPSQDKITLDAIDECSDFKSQEVNKYKMLVLNDGGENLEEFAKRIATEPDGRIQIEKFWIEAHRMFLGLSKFLDAGIVHHDLKHKNMVYNEKLNRINFIDFGLMTTMENIRKEAKKSKYGFCTRHWSFPPEMLFIDYHEYMQFADTEIKTARTKTKSEKTKRQLEFAKFLNELKDPDSHMNTIFLLTDPDFREKKQESFAVQQHTNEYYRMVMTALTKENYKEFLEKTISTIDSYGLATGLIYVLNKTRHLINEKMADDLYNLFFNMMNFNTMERISINDAMARYEDILQDNRILEKYKKHFENHVLVSDIQMESQKQLESIKIPNVKVSDYKLESDPVSECPKSTVFDKKKKKCMRTKRARSSNSKKTSTTTKKRTKI